MTLNEIGLKYLTDKASTGHNYLDFYERFIQKYKNEIIMLVEAGVGGYEYPDRGGESLRMWREYFPEAFVHGIDKYDKSGVNINNVFLHKISQADEEGLHDLFGTDPVIDVFIDDASHINPLSIQTFEIMFPLVKPGGVYIWEDIHTSLWEKEYKGNPEPMTEGTALHFLSRLVYGLQADTIEEARRSHWDGHVEEIHFHRNTCVIIKRK